ncbi:MAG: DUF6163 family protein [Pseudomonadota bacterium]
MSSFDTDNRVDTIQDWLVWFLRSIGVVFLIFGIFAWQPIIGLSEDTASHFINLTRPRQVEAVIFAVLLPSAGVGLWMGASWGVGLIVLSLLTNVGLPFGFSQYFEPDWLLIAAHVGIIVVFIVVKIVMYRLR